MKRNYIFFVCLLGIITACEIDNYDPPNGGIYGRLIDSLTQKNFQTQQPDGFNVRLYEKGWSTNNPLTISGKPDGTFENAYLFQNEYRVSISEGAFFPIDTMTVQVGKRTELNVSVMPFLALVDVDVTPSAGKLSVSYRIIRDRAAGQILDRRTLVSEIPTVNNVVFDHQQVTDLSSVPDEDILSSAFTDEISGLASGKTYYVRVASRIQSASGRYNYSEAVKVTLP